MKKNKKIEQEKLFKSGEVMSILENMSDGIQLVSEQHGEIVKRLDGIVQTGWNRWQIGWNR